MKEIAPSKQSAAKTVYATLKILNEAGGQLAGKEVINRIRNSVTFSDWEKQIYEKTGNVRWESILHFYTIDAIKAGFMRKSKGLWYITNEGKQALSFEPLKLLDTISKAYIQWAAGNNSEKQKKDNEITEFEEHKTQSLKANLDLLEEQAINGIKDYIFSKNPYEFQDIVAALLRAMKYHTPFISPKGKDGGIDIIAYRDPLGATTPRIKVQVKHKPDSTITVSDIRSLIGVLNKDGDVGLFVTSGYFTNDSEKFARDSHIHVKLIDIDNFISLWQEFYFSLTDEEKNLLPLHSIYFLGSNE